MLPLTDRWESTQIGTERTYVVQTAGEVVKRCLLMSTDPGDLVLDPTCGSGTTAYVAEQWGRRWITIDTSRVALALARTRLMGARYPFYLLADSRDGQIKEASRAVDSGQGIVKKQGIVDSEGAVDSKKGSSLSTDNYPLFTAPLLSTSHYSLKQGFVYERVPHITLKSIANNAEIDTIWEKFQEQLEPLREKLNQALVGAPMGAIGMLVAGMARSYKSGKFPARQKTLGMPRRKSSFTN